METAEIRNIITTDAIKVTTDALRTAAEWLLSYEVSVDEDGMAADEIDQTMVDHLSAVARFLNAEADRREVEKMERQIVAHAKKVGHSVSNPLVRKEIKRIARETVKGA